MFARQARFVVCTAALIVVVAQIPAEGATKSLKPDPTATLTVANAANTPSVVDPQKYAGSFSGTNFMFASYDRLLQLTADNTLAPMLAESWKWDSTGTVLTFNLRKDVKFQDGTPFTADVAVQNIKRSTEAGSNGQTLLTSMIGVTAVDQYTLRLNFSTVDPAIIYIFQFYPGMMASPAGLANPNLFKTQSVGSGAYKITSIGADGTYVMERNDNYWDKTHVYPLKIILTPAVDETTRLNAIKTGQADFGFVSSQTYQSAKSDTTLQVQHYTAIAPWYLFINNTIAPFDKPEVRKAVSLAIDRKAIAASQAGLFEPSAQAFAPGVAGYVPSLKPTTDLAQAKKLMQQAGVTSANVKYIYSVAEPYPTIAKILQNQLAQIGLNVEIIGQPGATARVFWRTSGDALFAGPPIITSPDPVAFMDTAFLGFDNPGIKDPKLVDMVAKARQFPLGSKDRTAAFEEISRYLYDNPGNVVAFAVNDNVFVGSKRLIGIDKMPIASISLGPDMHFLQIAKTK